MRKTNLLCFGAALLVLVPAVAGAASISPSSFSASIDVGDIVTVDKTVTLDPSAVGVVDIFFLADNTGSMTGVINNVKSVADSLLTDLDSAFTSAAFGVGRYLGDPVEGVAPSTAYQLQQGITTSLTPVGDAIDAWYASGGGDGPEANFFALHQVATEGGDYGGGVGNGTGQVTGWRTGSTKVIVWFGDAVSHTSTVDQLEAIAALTGENVIVVAMNSSIDNFGIDTSDQATDIAAATDGALINSFASVPLADVLSTITDAVDAVTTTIDLDLAFFDTLDDLGVEVTFVPTDPDGYTDVPGGATRIFTVSFKGLTPGVYSGIIGFSGVDAVEADRITVGDVAVPEPSTFALLGLGVLGLGAVVRRRRKS